MGVIPPGFFNKLYNIMQIRAAGTCIPSFSLDFIRGDNCHYRQSALRVVFSLVNFSSGFPLNIAQLTCISLQCMVLAYLIICLSRH
jgi:hypothetical protein